MSPNKLNSKNSPKIPFPFLDNLIAGGRADNVLARKMTFIREPKKEITNFIRGQIA